MAPVKGAGLQLLIEIKTVHRLPHLIKVAKVSPQKFVAKNPCHDGLP
jgi:hypothetical protein